MRGRTTPGSVNGAVQSSSHILHAIDSAQKTARNRITARPKLRNTIAQSSDLVAAEDGHDGIRAMGIAQR